MSIVVFVIGLVYMVAALVGIDSPLDRGTLFISGSVFMVGGFILQRLERMS